MEQIKFTYANIIAENNGITVVKRKSLSGDSRYYGVTIDYDADSGLYTVTGSHTNSFYYSESSMYSNEDIARAVKKLDPKFIELKKVKVKPKRKFFSSWLHDEPVQYVDVPEIKVGYVYYSAEHWFKQIFKSNNILIKEFYE